MKTLTLNDTYFAIVKRGLAQVMLVRGNNKWVPTSSMAFYRYVPSKARVLSPWGLTKGHRLAILPGNRPESAVAEFAALLLRAVVVPIYATLAPQQTANITCDPGVKVTVVCTERHLQKVLSIKNQTDVEHVEIMDQPESTDAVHMRWLLHAGRTERDVEREDRARTINTDHLASIIYNWGTTGDSKGAQPSHVSFRSYLHHSLEHLAEGFKFPAGDMRLGHSVLGA